MLTKLLIGWSLAALCVVVHAMGMTAVSRWLKQATARVGARFWLSTWLLVRVAGWTVSETYVSSAPVLVAFG